MNQLDFKKILPYVAIVAIFAFAAAIYFTPALRGEVVYAGDNVNGIAAAMESVDYHKNTDDYSYWTGSMFSGMPNYQIGGGGSTSLTVGKILYPLNRIATMGLRNTAVLFLFYLISFFILLRAFKIDKWISVAGSFAISLSSYFFIVIAAQHHGKCYSITWMMLVLVGFLLIFRKKYGWGAVLVMLFTYIGFYRHPQMSYYICMLIGMLFFAELYNAWKNKTWKHLGIATAVFGVSFVVGLGMGSSNLFTNIEYAEQTMRGGHSDLKKAADGENKTSGLDLDYATAWSYGIDETLTLLIPNFEGAASGYDVGEKSVLYKQMTKLGWQKSAAKQFCQNAPTYRGEKAFTSGPVYVGAVVFFLFVLALLVVKGPYKWALVAATVFSVLLAWGHHFMWLTEFFFKYFPAYNKFRAVESILIVAEIAIPLLAFLALKEISEKKIDYVLLKKNIFVSAGITAGICLIVAVFSGAFDVTSTYDEAWKANIPDKVYSAILDQRTDMIRSDAWRSFVFVLLGAVLTFSYMRHIYEKQSANATMWFGLGLAVLIVCDMWTVDKRFCNDGMFRSVRNRDKAFEKLPYEKELLQDTTHFRVLNLSTNTFNEARTSYYLKSIGGYSAAKLRRYQDLIDEHIAPEMSPLLRAIAHSNAFTTAQVNGDSIFPVLNMLNMKYAIVPLQTGDAIPIENPFAMGNAWFVDTLKVVQTANEECDALRTINLRKVAVLDKSFAEYATNEVTVPDSTATIELTKYTPRYIDYTAHLSTDKTAVFSEIYYPYGWTAYVDDVETPIFRVNYMLRAINLKAGEHRIRLEFAPDSASNGERLALFCFAVFFLTLVATVVYEVKRRKEA